MPANLSPRTPDHGPCRTLNRSYNTGDRKSPTRRRSRRIRSGNRAHRCWSGSPCRSRNSCRTRVGTRQTPWGHWSGDRCRNDKHHAPKLAVHRSPRFRSNDGKSTRAARSPTLRLGPISPFIRRTRLRPEYVPTRWDRVIGAPGGCGMCGERAHRRHHRSAVQRGWSDSPGSSSARIPDATDFHPTPRARVARLGARSQVRLLLYQRIAGWFAEISKAPPRDPLVTPAPRGQPGERSAVTALEVVRDTRPQAAPRRPSSIRAFAPRAPSKARIGQGARSTNGEALVVAWVRGPRRRSRRRLPPARSAGARAPLRRLADKVPCCCEQSLADIGEIDAHDEHDLARSGAFLCGDHGVLLSIAIEACSMPSEH
jgi:hypothetical protein